MILSLNSFADVTGGTSIVDNLDPYELGYDFKKDGIYYKILGGDSVSTSEGETPYVGRVIIPDEVTYNNVTYKITKVSGFRNSPDVTENSLYACLTENNIIPVPDRNTFAQRKRILIDFKCNI